MSHYNPFHESEVELSYRAEKRPVIESSPRSFWWAYALVLLGVAMLWRALA